MAIEDLDLPQEARLTLAAKLVLGLVGFVGVILFARVLGASGLGTYYFGLTLVHLGSRVANGIGTAVKKRTSEVQSDAGHLLWAGLLLYAGTSLLIVVGFLLLHPLVVPYTGGRLNAGLIAICFVVLGGFYITKNAYEALGHPSRGVWADALRAVLVFSLQAAVLGSGGGVTGLFVGFALGTGVITLVLYPLTGLTVTPTWSPPFDSLLEFARWSVPTHVLECLYEHLPVLILMVTLGSATTGIYEAAKRLTSPGVMVARSLSEPLIVKVSGLDSIGRQDDVRTSTEWALSYAGLLAIPICFGVALLGDLLMVTFYGPDFADAGLVLIGLALFQVLHVYRYPFWAALDGSNRPRANLISTIGAAVLTGALSLLVVGWLGIVGVVAATVVAEAMRFGYYETLSASVFSGVFTPSAWRWQLIAGSGMYAALGGLSGLSGVDLSDPLRLVVFIGLGGVIYVGGLISLDLTVRRAAIISIRKMRIVK